MAANWSHPTTSAHTAPSGPIIQPGQIMTVTGKPASSANGDLTIKTATGSSASTIETSTRTTVNADGTTTTTTVRLTKFGSAKNVTISGTYTSLDGVTKSYTFTFASLNSGPQTFGSPPAVVTATPDAATGRIKVQLSNGHKGGSSVTVKIGKAADKTTLASNPAVNIGAVSAFSSSKTTTDVVSVLNPDNTTTTTTTATTVYGAPTNIKISGTFDDFSSTPAHYSFTFASMSSPSQSKTSNFTTVTVTPNAATNTLTLTYVTDGATVTLVSKVTPPPPTTNTTEKTIQPQHSAVATGLASPPSEEVAGVTPGELPTPVVVTPVASGASEAEIEIERCGVETPTCVANVLDAYAAKLDAIAPKLPEKMRILPTVFREAARKVRAAKSKAEAVRAIRAAITQVRNSISFLRADDPDQRALGTQVGREAVGVLQAASVKLERATGL